MTRTGRRRTDHYLLDSTWERIVESSAYNPQWEQNPGGTGPSTTNLRDIIQAGMWLQRAVSEKWMEETTHLVDFLSKSASLEDKKDNYEDSLRERIAAAYFLWPFHAGRYYNYLETAKEQRLESRQALCDIQQLLYNNMRGLLDALRLWFEDVASDEDSRKYLTEKTYREKWRPRELIGHVPDLCAVDRLAVHMLDITKARPLIRKAMESIQALSLNSDEEVAAEVGPAVIEAFKALHVTQMTVFYYPKPVEVRDKDDIPLYELVYNTGDRDSTPAKLIPFDTDEILARNFRKLATHIYSIRERDKKRYPNFIAQRNATIDELKKATTFISDGATTKFFLSNEPPARKKDDRRDSQENSSNGSEIIKQAAKDWPVWYNKALHTTELGGDLPDWNNWEFWWEHIEQDQLSQMLFPGPSGARQVHENDHMSAYWDNLVASTGEFHDDQIVIPTDCPTGEDYRFGYLMELMLRREEETRTSFFFALAQTYGKKRPRLYQFVGGTFLGLEWPGVPFSEERFKALGARVRGLVMAVAHYTTTHAVKSWRDEEARMKNSFEQRVITVVRLLRGTDRRGKFPRKGLLFATPLDPMKKTDHDYTPRDNTGWTPSRHQIKSVFGEAGHLEKLPPTAVPDRDCETTWKALFYLGGEADRHNTLHNFLDQWDEYQARNKKTANPQVADRAVICHDCLRAVLSYLLDDMYEALSDKIKISEKSLRLPSRPGIRFLIALCRFITNVQSRAVKEYASIESIEFEPESVTFKFDQPNLLQGIWERIETARPNFEHTTGILLALQDSLVFSKEDPASSWQVFLNSNRFACHLEMEKLDDDCTLRLRWTK